MHLHESTFEYLKPTEEQLTAMSRFRLLTVEYADQIELLIPDGPDKTYMLRKVREVSMWGNVSLTRNADGSPRQ